jgi:hypothetical protein
MEGTLERKASKGIGLLLLIEPEVLLKLVFSLIVLTPKIVKPKITF